MNKVDKKNHLESLIAKLRLLQKQKRNSNEDWERDIEKLLNFFAEEFHREKDSVDSYIEGYLNNLVEEKNKIIKYLEQAKRNPTKRKEIFDKAIEEFIDDIYLAISYL
jgi:hypothetical protein